MQMKQCQNGHFYDQTVHADCPYCSEKGSGSYQPQNNTVPVSAEPQIGKTVPIGANNNESGTPDYDRTVAIIKKEMGIDPVVGWLVCVDGKEKGRDYKIHSDNNFVGRGEKMDICVRGDDTISRENHAIISYDSKDKVYYLSPGEGRSIVRLNEKALFTTQTLNAYDKIELGNTKFIFIPLCNDNFSWGD